MNGFSNNPEGRRMFGSFLASVREVEATQAFTYQKFYNLNDIEFITVDIHTIDIYLYELSTQYLNKDAEKVKYTSALQPSRFRVHRRRPQLVVLVQEG